MEIQEYSKSDFLGQIKSISKKMSGTSKKGDWWGLAIKVEAKKFRKSCSLYSDHEQGIDSFLQLFQEGDFIHIVAEERFKKFKENGKDKWMVENTIETYEFIAPASQAPVKEEPSKPTTPTITEDDLPF